MKQRKIKLGILLALTTSLVIFGIFLTFLSPYNHGLESSSDIGINFEKIIGKIKISYGANEDNWQEFTNNPINQDFHKEVNSEYIRIWLSAQYYKQSTFPLQKDGTYDYGVVDSYIDAVLNSDATPFVVFAHYSVCGSGVDRYPPELDFSSCEGHGVPPAHDDNEFADYLEKVTRHFKERCESGGYSHPCNINNWYFEIWNEPYADEWWSSNPPRYSIMFNLIYPRIKAIAPGSKVGGPSGAYVPSFPWYTERMAAFLANSQPDFVSIHHYGNMLSQSKYNDEQRIRDVDVILYQAPIALRKIAIQNNQPNVEIINSEYSSDNSIEYMSRLDEPFTAAWYASALISQIKSQEINMELFYGGVSGLEDGGFGMWGKNGILFPTYYMKKSFVKYNLEGSSIFETGPSSKIELLAIENDKGNFITIVNKQNAKELVNIEIKNKNFKELIDLNADSELNILNGEVSLIFEPYEIKFMQFK